MNAVTSIAELPAVEKYTLMLLYASKGKVRGKLWFQKEMFELSKIFPELAEELDFDAYSYGPFSEGLEEYRDMLETSGLICRLELTDAGYKIGEMLWKKEDERKKEIIQEIARFLENLEYDELLLYVYVTSPNMAEMSDVREKILRNRVEIALRMLKAKKVSVGLAARLAGLPYKTMVEEALKQGIKPFEAQGNEVDNN